MLLGLLMTGGVYAVLAPATAQETKADQELIDQGRELFLVGCSSCHGTNGEGVSTNRTGYQFGPSLVGVGAAAVDFQVGTGRMPMARPAQQAPRKDRVYNDQEIEALAAFIADLGPGPAIPDAADYSLDGLSEAEREEAIVRGGQIFLTNCTACHNYNGSGGAMPRGGYAPSLKGVDEKHIYEAMLTGPQAMDVFSNGNLSPEEKRDVIAYIKSIENTPSTAASASAGSVPCPRACSPGSSAWAAWWASRSGSQPTRPARRRTRWKREPQRRQPAR